MSTESTENKDGKQILIDILKLLKLDDKILKTARDALDKTPTGNVGNEDIGNDDYYSHNMMRKKLKRWFDRCKKKKASDENTQEGDLCYHINKEGAVLLGKRAKKKNGDDICIQCPRLCFFSSQYYGAHFLIITEKKAWSIEVMTYKEFEPIYKEVFRKNVFASFFENLRDGFMSYTQLPRQELSNDYNKATSVGGHVANIATRVFSPVIAPGVGLYAGAVAAYEGAKALKKKLIPTKEELKRMGNDEINDLSNKYAKTDNENLKDLQTSLIAKWQSGALPGMSYNNLKEVLKENQKIYGNQPNKNLNVVNNVNTMNVAS